MVTLKLAPFVGASLGLAGLYVAIKGVGAIVAGKDMGFVQLTVGLALGYSLCYVGWRVAGAPGGERLRKPDLMAALASKWMRRVDQTRQFPEVEIGDTILPQGERALLSERSRMIGHKERLARTTGGTLVMVGQQPFYFGRRDPVSRRSMAAAVAGRLTLTNQALLFSGNARAFTVDLITLKSIEPYSRDAIIVSVHGRSKTSIFLVSNPILWSLVVRIASRVSLAEECLPDRVSFDHGAASAVTSA